MVHSEIKLKMRRCSVTSRELAEHLGVPQGTLRCRLNGFLELSSEDERRIDQYLEAKCPKNEI